MCGIAGAVSARPVDHRVVGRMRDQLAHRGPDHAGLWQTDDLRACLGHRRLAVLDLSPDANQPLHSAGGRFVVTLNGEIYNHALLRRELSAHGARFRTRSDTEVLVEAFARWGEGCLERLAGMFAFAIWDRVERRLFCARDRAGEKPFHYATVGDTFLFASELKALLEWPGLRREVSQPAVIDFLRLGFVPDPKSIWEGCHKLAPGHCLWVTLEDRGPIVGAPTCWWDMAFEPDRGVEDWGPEIRDTLARAAADMALADVPIGTFLSGGVDSSSITAALGRTGRRVRTFTIGFDEDGYDERPWARQVAERYGTDHTERVVAPTDVAPVLDRLHWHYDEPFNDHSYLPTYYVSREARQAVTVALSGDGGDEAFGGYRKYRRLATRTAVDPLVPSFVGSGVAQAAGALLPASSRTRTVLTQYGQTASSMLTGAMLPGLSAAALAEATRGPLRAALAHYDPEDGVAQLLQGAPPAEVGLVNAMRYLDMKLTLAGGILVKVDRASMAVALEVRPVYLHPDVLALAGRIPPERLATRAEAKKALKDAFRPWLSQALLHRPKAGFAMPLGPWLCGQLGGMSESRTGDDPLAEIIDPLFVDRLAHGHATGRMDATSALHSFMFLRQWLRRWL